MLLSTLLSCYHKHIKGKKTTCLGKKFGSCERKEITPLHPTQVIQETASRHFLSQQFNLETLR